MNQRMLLVGWVALLGVAGANAQNKISGTIKCNKSEPAYKLEVGDRPEHAMMLEKNTCTATQPWEIGGDKYKEGYSVVVSEANSSRVTTNGYHVATYESGDKAVVAIHITTFL